MAYLKGAYAQHSSLPSPSLCKLVSSRRIDFVARRYVVDSDGNFEGMDDTAQRVMLAVSFAAPTPPRFVTDRDFEARKKQIRAALADLEKEGAITVRDITIAAGAAGVATEQVEFTNHHTGANETVERVTG